MVEFTPEKSEKIALARLDLLNQWKEFRRKNYQNRGIISKKCVFQVKRITDKNNFDINRIVFN